MVIITIVITVTTTLQCVRTRCLNETQNHISSSKNARTIPNDRYNCKNTLLRFPFLQIPPHGVQKLNCDQQLIPTLQVLRRGLHGCSSKAVSCNASGSTTCCSHALCSLISTRYTYSGHTKYFFS